MSQPIYTYVVQSATDERFFLIISNAPGHGLLDRVALRGMLDEAHEFYSSHEAATFAGRHLARDSWVVRTLIDGQLKPLPRKELVTR